MLEPQQRREDFKLDLPNFYTDDTDLPEMEDLPHAKKPWWRQRRGIVAISAGLVVILVAGTLATVLANRKTPVTYTTQQVSQGNLAITVSATGPLSGNIYNVNFTGSGKIAEIDVSVGQKVTAGQLLAKLDPTSLQDAINQAQAQVNSAQTSLNNAITSRNNTYNQTQASLALAYDQEQTAIHTCNTEPSPPPNCVAQAENQYWSAQTQAASQNASAQNQVNSAQQQLNAAKTSLTAAQHNLSNASVTAPGAGTVAAINGVVGGTPGSGSGSGSSSGSSAFIQIVDLTSLQVTAGVNEADISGLATGQPASFTVSAYSGRVFRGTVSAISPIGQTTSNVVTYPVTINVDMQTAQGASLLPGMTATISITTAQRIGVLLIPASAITFARAAAIPANGGFLTRTQVTTALQQARQMVTQLQSADASGGTGASNIGNDRPAPAYVLERANGQWVVKPIVVGLTNGSTYEVLAGLNQGETIVTGEQGGTLTTGTSTGTGTGGFGGGRFGGGGSFGGGGRGGAGG